MDEALTFPTLEVGSSEGKYESEFSDNTRRKGRDNLPELVALIRDHFDKAKSAKGTKINQRLIDCLLAFKSEYSPEKLAQIREVGGTEIFVPLTNIKVRAGKAWLTDAFFQPNEKMFSLQPTPVPDLPDDQEEAIRAQVMEEFRDVILKAFQLSVLSGGTFDISSISKIIEDRKEQAKEEILRKIKDKADKLCKIEEKRIHDQFVEGGFYEAFSSVIHDIMIYPTAIMKGVILRKQKRFVASEKNVVEVVAPTYNRVSPFDAFPAPDASSFDDGYFIELLHLTPKDLRSMIGVEGYYEDAIKDILERHASGGLKEWVTGDTERKWLEGKDDTYSDTIDVIEYWGTVEGRLLKEWDIEVDDETEFYDICAWVADNRLLKAILNPDPLGQKPYVKASFIEVPDSFWGIALPEVLDPIQNAVNALARAAINNAVISSGALIERNIDRLGPDSPKQIIPFQMFDVHESAINAAPAYRFYQLSPIADRVALLMQVFQKMADEYSGIPAYAHGDVTVGGAGRALADYEEVVTDRGNIPIADLKVGDLVANRHGSLSKVLGVFPQGEKEIFRITFHNGVYIDCTEDHLWFITYIFSPPSSKYRSARVVTTAELASMKLLNKESSGKVRALWGVPGYKTIKGIVDGNPYILRSRKFIVKVEKMDFTHSATCIKVDSEDSLFLTAKGIVTHNTASGLSMLQNHAIRGIKEVVKNIDDGIIEPLVRMQYYFNLYNYVKDTSEVPDLTINARGSINLLEKEAQTNRMLEFLQITSNPIDAQLIGHEGRQFLLESIARNAGIDVTKLFSGSASELAQMMAPVMQQLQSAGGRLPAPAENPSSPVAEQAQQLGQNVSGFAKENG
jgi:hypothetical protein